MIFSLRYPAFPLTLLMTVLLPWQAPAIELVPFATRNQNPLVQIFGLPAAEPSTLLATGEYAMRLTLDIGNSYAGTSTSKDLINLDGETYRTNLALRHGFQKGFEIGLDIPYISHNGGFLDGFIENWHRTFNLPEGERDQTSRDQLDYRYQRNGETLVQVMENGQGFGDLRLSSAWQLIKEDGPSPGTAALRVGLKLPTGDSDQLLGSGSTDLSLEISGQRETPVEQGTLAAFASLGALLMSKGEVIKNRQRSAAVFGSLGIAWGPYDWLAFKLQLDGHTAIFKNTGLTEIGSDSAQLVMGGSLKVADRTTLDLAVCEDIVVDTAPDVVFHLALRTIF